MGENRNKLTLLLRMLSCERSMKNITNFITVMMDVSHIGFALPHLTRRAALCTVWVN